MSQDASDDSGAGFGIVPRHLRGTLTLNEIGVYVGLSWRANAYGKLWIRHKRLAEEVGSSVSTVQRALRGLRDKGVVTWVPRVNADGSTDSNTYTLHVFHQAPPPGHIDRGGRSERPGGSVNMTGGVGQDDRQNETPGTRPQERESRKKKRGAGSSSSSPSVARGTTTTPDGHLDAAGLAARDRGRFKTWLREVRNARNANAIILTEAGTGELAESVREWRRSLDVETEPDAEPVECPHGLDIALGEHMCPQCDPARHSTRPPGDVEPEGRPAPDWIRDLARSGAAGDPAAWRAALSAADETTAGGVTPSILEGASTGARQRA